MKEIVKNAAHISIVKICSSCQFCLSDVAIDTACKYRACLLPERVSKRVLPTSICEKWTMSEKLANLRFVKENMGQVKRKEYLDFVLWANTHENAPSEIKKMNNEQLREYWEKKNKKSIYLNN